MIQSKFNINKNIFLCLVPLSLTFTGCFGYRDVVDPYYPKRYNVDARNSVRTALAPQVSNGNVLDQTVWDFHFETGKPELNAMGKEHLERLARRRPVAQEVIFLQVTRNLDTKGTYEKITDLNDDEIKKLTKAEQKDIKELKKLYELKKQKELKENYELNKIQSLVELKKSGVLKDKDLIKLKELVEKNKIKELNKINELKELNMARSENIKAYMNKISQDKVHPEFQVVLHDPAEVSGSGIEAETIITGKQSGVKGSITYISQGQSGSSSGESNSGQSSGGGGGGDGGGSSGTGGN